MTRLPPVPVVRAATAARTALQTLTRRMVPPDVALLELASGFMATHAIYAAARLGIADALAGGPLSPDDVAAEIGTDPDATHRLLRALASLGILREDPDGQYELTPLSQGLRTTTPDSMAPVVLFLGDPLYQAPWGQLTRTVQTGAPGAEAVLGMPMWEYLDHDRAFAATVNDAMTRLTALDWPAVRAAYDVSGFSTIVDVGGGHGRLLSLMLDAAPSAKGVLLERATLVDGAERLLSEAGVLDRCRIEAGSFFESVPDDGDLYVLRRDIHDFDDEQAVAVLTTVRRHMPAGARLVVLESVVPSDSTPHFAKALDLDMMIFVGGRERTERELTTLLDRAGLRVTRVVPTISTLSVVEAVAARHA
jgi:hypothetical protein